MIEVVKAGRWTTVQDRGRPGFERFGIPPGGAADWFAAAAANRLVGNHPDAALLECLATGPALQFREGCVVAVTGGQTANTAGWRAISMTSGSLLEVGAIGPGLRAYLAVRGGIDVPLVLGSRSFCQRGAFGGGFGRPLVEGDRLAIGDASHGEPLAEEWPGSHRLSLRGPWDVRVIPGPHQDAFGPSALRRLTATACRITPQLDRMGMRIATPGLRLQAAEILTTPVTAGAIQVTPSGELIALLVDHQTTGGYPVIATVINADLPLLAQARPDETVRFRDVDAAEAARAGRRLTGWLQPEPQTHTIFGEGVNLGKGGRMLNHVINRLIDRQRWLEPVADVLQKLVGGIYKALGGPGHALKTFLHGTWLGHPLHPVLTDIPIGAWTIAILFDLSYLIERSHGWVSAADVTIFIGLLGALGAAVTGYTDWSDTIGRERRVGITHGLLNTLVIVLYLVSFILRVAGGSRGLAILLAYAGYLLVVSAAFLGGDLVFSIGTGVNHHAWQEVPTKFTKVLLEGQLTDNMLIKAMAGDTPILLYKKGDTVCAISETCSHAGGPLSEGELDGNLVQCPWHASRFDVCTGQVKGGPATISQVRYETRVQNGQIEVRRSEDTLQPN